MSKVGRYISTFIQNKCLFLVWAKLVHSIYGRVCGFVPTLKQVVILNWRLLISLRNTILIYMHVITVRFCSFQLQTSKIICCKKKKKNIFVLEQQHLGCHSLPSVSFMPLQIFFVCLFVLFQSYFWMFAVCGLTNFAAGGALPQWDTRWHNWLSFWCESARKRPGWSSGR